MGLFSFVGKALKTVGKVAGFIPGVGGIVGKAASIAGGILAGKGSAVAQKASLMRSPQQMRGLSPPFIPSRGNMTAGGYAGTYQLGPRVLRMTPTMPGGAVSTPSGMQSSGAVPPMAFGGRGTSPAPKRRKRRTSSSRRASAPRRRKTRLKFGSRAWRAKYLKRRR